MARYGLLTAAIAAGAAAQAVPTVDSNTGITFAAFKDETTGAQFGLALPQTYTGDFIGQIVAPAGNTSAGWAGLSLGPGMINNLLVPAWANDQEIVSSFRKATDYIAPGAYPGANFTATPIAAGTFVNSTHYSYTFLCSGCLSVQANFQGADTTGTGVGWAVSTTELADTTSADTALNFHSAGQGIFTLSFADAQSAQFAEWAALAGSDSTPTAPDDETPDEAPVPAPVFPPMPTGGFGGPEAGAPAPVPDAPAPVAGAPDAVLPAPPVFPALPTGFGPRRPRPVRRPRPAARPLSSEGVRPNVAPFRPAFNPDAAKGNDFEDAQRFKASFLERYYQG